MTQECSIEGCAKRIKSRSLCSAHYERKRLHGTTAAPVKTIGADRFDQTYRTAENGCLEWAGSKTHNGYGQLYDGTAMVRAHRFAWERANGPIPVGMVVDHTCFNRACVNVDHMRLLTSGQNNQNREGAQDRNKSGIRNVYWSKDKSKWFVRMGVSGRYLNFGYFSDKDEAGKVAATMRAEHMPYALR